MGKNPRRSSRERSLVESVLVPGVSLVIVLPLLIVFSPIILFLVARSQISRLAVRFYCRKNKVSAILALSSESATSSILNEQLVPLLDTRAIIIEPDDSRKVLSYIVRNLSDAKVPFLLFVENGRKLRPIELDPIINRKLAGNSIKFDNLKVKIHTIQQKRLSKPTP